MVQVLEKIDLAIYAKKPFVIYRKPNADVITTVFQKDDSQNEIKSFIEKGFVFAPFDDRKKTLFIPFFKAEKMDVNIDNSFVFNMNENIDFNLLSDKNSHINLIENGISFIQQSTAKKIVLSRRELLKNTNFDIYEVFNRLIKSYSTAFVYCWYHPVSGLWMGATPERLLSVCNNEFKVMALASTQEYKGTLKVNWGDKELQEHQFVVDYIASKFENKEINISNTYTIKAGNLLHLRADISGKISDGNSFFDLLKMLHPTPATCGLPKEISKNFILKNESYNREYYTGYLGEVGEQSADLFVNLRCMKIDSENNNVSLYIGGGITKDSNSESEWLETVAKSKVMKKVL